MLTKHIFVILQFMTLPYRCYTRGNWNEHKFEIGSSKKAWAFNYDQKSGLGHHDEKLADHCIVGF